MASKSMKQPRYVITGWNIFINEQQGLGWGRRSLTTDAKTWAGLTKHPGMEQRKLDWQEKKDSRDEVKTKIGHRKHKRRIVCNFSGLKAAFVLIFR